MQATTARDSLPVTATENEKAAAEQAVKKAAMAAGDSSSIDRTIAPFSVRKDLKRVLKPTIVHMNAGGKDNRVASMVIHGCVTPGVTTLACVP